MFWGPLPHRSPQKSPARSPYPCPFALQTLFPPRLFPCWGPQSALWVCREGSHTPDHPGTSDRANSEMTEYRMWGQWGRAGVRGSGFLGASSLSCPRVFDVAPRWSIYRQKGFYVYMTYFFFYNWKDKVGSSIIVPENPTVLVKLLVLYYKIYMECIRLKLYELWELTSVG